MMAVPCGGGGGEELEGGGGVTTVGGGLGERQSRALREGTRAQTRGHRLAVMMPAERRARLRSEKAATRGKEGGVEGKMLAKQGPGCGDSE